MNPVTTRLAAFASLALGASGLAIAGDLSTAPARDSDCLARTFNSGDLQRPLPIRGWALEVQDASSTKGGTQVSHAFEADLKYTPAPRVALRLGYVAAHVDSPRADGDRILAGLGVDAGNDGRSRWLHPLTATITVQLR